jgi:hypothetical protein
MGRMYSATFEEVAVTAAQDLFQILAPADSTGQLTLGSNHAIIGCWR